MEKQKRSRSNTKIVEKPVLVPEIGKLPPQAQELEEAVLGALMLEKDAYSVISDILKPESFYNPQNNLIFGAIQDLGMQQKPVDLLTVVEELKRKGELESAGGAHYVAELSEKVASAAHIEYHARIIAQKYMARELISFSSSVNQQAFDETIDVDDLLQETEGKLFEISQRNVKKDVIQINPIIKEALLNIEKAANRKDGMSGISTGFKQINSLTSGWQKSDLIIIAARPAMGKTAFVLSMAKNMAVDSKIPVGIFSLEMSNVQLVNRLLVNVCQVRGESIKSGRLEKDEWERLHVRQQYLYDAPIYIDDTPSLSVFELRTKARRLVREKKVEVIIIDYLQLMNASGMNFGSREQEVSMISRSLKGLAKELDIPIIALSQLNRGVENRPGAEGKRPQLADLRESGAIEQDADIVCFIHRPEYYGIHEGADGQSLIGAAEIIVAKHRNGPTGIARLIFDNEYARFLNQDDKSLSKPKGYVEIGSKMNNTQPQDNESPVPQFSQTSSSDFMKDKDDNLPF